MASRSNQGAITTYLTAHAPDLEYEIKKLGSRSNEDNVHEVWMTILGWTFPSEIPLKFRLKHEKTISPEKRYDFEVTQLVKPAKEDKSEKSEDKNKKSKDKNKMSPSVEIHFLMIECKAARYEGHGKVWEAARIQCRDHLQQIFPNPKRERSSPNTVWGSVAIGKYVRFFLYEDGELLPLEGYENVLHLIHDHENVQGFLNLARDEIRRA